MARVVSPSLLVFAVPAAAWFDTGHMLVAEIAKLQLARDEAARLDALLSHWAVDYPGMSDLVGCAVWMDHIKCGPGRPERVCPGDVFDALFAFDAWHYADLSYNPQGLPNTVTDAVAFGNPSSVWALGQGMRTLGSSDSLWSVNLMLRLVVHVVGDLHQPLHDTQGYFEDARFGHLPNGDRGGNLIPIKALPEWSEITNLHHLWDAVAGLYLDEWPLTSTQWSSLEANATGLIAAFPKEALASKGYFAGDLECFQDGSGNCRDVFERWARETSALAVTEAYGHGITAKETPSPEYLKIVRDVSRQQIALAGYRLADVLRAVLPKLPKVQQGGSNFLSSSPALSDASAVWSQVAAENQGFQARSLFAFAALLAVQAALLLVCLGCVQPLRGQDGSRIAARIALVFFKPRTRWIFRRMGSPAQGEDLLSETTDCSDFSDEE